MACACGGGSGSTSLLLTTTQQGSVASSFEYEVTFPNATRQTFDTEAEAYHAIRLTGGGVKRKSKT